MVTSTKACTKCGATKSMADFEMKKRKTGRFPSSWCRECKRRYQLEKWYRDGRPPQGWSRVPFDEWPQEWREKKIAYKAAKRREAGVPTRAQLAERAAAKKAADEAAKAEARKAREAAREAARVTPPGLSNTERFRWKYRNDPEFRERQKARTIAAKAKVPLWYANQQLGGTSEIRYPEPVLLAKQLQLKISRYLRENDHEEY